jgi:hypothetical protein
MTTIHIVRAGETLLSIAEQYGFVAWQTIADAPENASLIHRRGSAHALREGDELHIPRGLLGQTQVASTPSVSAVQAGLEGTPKHHKDVLRRPDPLLEIRVYCEFRRPEEPKDKTTPTPIVTAAQTGTLAGTKPGWNRGTTHLTVAEATISIGPGDSRTAATDRGGIVRFAALTDGTWTLRLDPHPDELSPGPAVPDAVRDHGQDWNRGNVTRTRARSKKKALEVEYRPLDLTIEVRGGAIDGVTITSTKRDDRPYHAMCFWQDVGAGPRGVTQVLEVDLKADFLRRLDAGGKGVHPPIRRRTATPGLRLFQVHHTTGNDIGFTINSFTGTRASGVHFVNDRDGHVVRMVDDHYDVQHGGGKGGKVENAWADETDINNQALGVENVQGKGEPFTTPQIASLIGIIREARELYPAIHLNHVIGHCDVFDGKFECPGPLFPWADLEKAGVALGPQAITDEAFDREWGGYFAGKDGAKRTLRSGDIDRKDEDGTFSLLRNGKVIVSGLTLGPVALLNECLHRIGYTPNRNGRKVANFAKWSAAHLGTFGDGTKAAMAFFWAHHFYRDENVEGFRDPVGATVARKLLGCYRSLRA